MHFITALIASAFTALAAAQSTANPFTNSDYSAISTGQAFTITWSPATTGTVSLILVKGDPAALTTVSTIASGLDNSGSFTWTPDSSIAAGSDYALKIVDDADDTIVNYTLQFPIDSAGTASSADTSFVASSTSTEGAVTDTTTSTADASTESAAPDITANTAEASPTDDSTEKSSTTLASTSTPDADASSSAFSAPENSASATTSPSSTTPGASKPSAVSDSSSSVAAAANVCAGLMGLVGATVLLL